MSPDTCLQPNAQSVTFRNIGVNITSRTFVCSRNSPGSARIAPLPCGRSPRPLPDRHRVSPAAPQASFYVVATASILLRYDNFALPAALDLAPGAFPPFATISGALAVATGFSYQVEAPRAGTPFAGLGELNGMSSATGRATGRLPLALVNYTRGGRTVPPACMAEASANPARVRSAFRAHTRERVRRAQELKRLRAGVAATGGDGAQGQQGAGRDSGVAGGTGTAGDARVREGSRAGRPAAERKVLAEALGRMTGQQSLAPSRTHQR